MKQHIENTLGQARDYLNAFMSKEESVSSLQRSAELLIETLKKGGAIYSCGNGGSMSDAMHFAEELTGRYRKSRIALSATAISDPGHISCVANDFG